MTYETEIDDEEMPGAEALRILEARIPPEQMAAIRAEVAAEAGLAPAPDAEPEEDWETRMRSDAWREAVGEVLGAAWRAVDDRHEAQPAKTRITMRVDKDVLAWFRERGRGHQTFMNAVLRAFVAASREAG